MRFIEEMETNRRRGWGTVPEKMDLATLAYGEKPDAPELRVGAVVRLKSGGPEMTVKCIVDGGERHGLIKTVWFTPMGALCTNEFMSDLLDVIR